MEPFVEEIVYLNSSAEKIQFFINSIMSSFRARTESLSSENASRLAGMQRAEKNIDHLLEDLGRQFHHLRQSNIDEELFDVVSVFEALVPKKMRKIKLGEENENSQRRFYRAGGQKSDT